jgi:flagellar biosynthesis protein FlhF
MTINKYQGKTKEEAVEKARQELGNGAVVLNVKEIKPKGFFGAFKKSTFEVTAAMEEREQYPQGGAGLQPKRNVSEQINLAADEPISVKPTVEKNIAFNHITNQEKVSPMSENSSVSKTEGLEKRLESLSNILEKQLSTDEAQQEDKIETQKSNPESFQFIKMLYRTLLDNDVNEKYVNQILEEAEKILRSGSNVDYILSNVYQKMILKFGQPSPIQLNGRKPKAIFFIGPTGVGKTTTIAKIASKYKVELGKKVAFLTADTYRIAATEQLRVYANILDAPMSIIYSVEEMNAAIERAADYDLVFIDTAGFSHKSESQCQDMKKMLDGLSEEYEKEVYLVLSATTKYKDLLEIADTYKEISDYKLIFTKLDETSTYGNILNIRLYSGAALSYMTNGQNVPDDIEEFDTQKIVKQLLGGR